MTRRKAPKEALEAMMSVSDAARYLSLSTRTVYRMVEELPAIRIDGRWRFRVRDLDHWILRRRSTGEPLPEPVDYAAGEALLHPYIDVRNIFVDAQETRAPALIRGALDRARLAPAAGSEKAAKDQIYEAILEREKLCSTALHPDAAFPHPRDPEKSPLAEHQIIVVRAAGPVDFGEVHGYKPRIVFILLARAAPVQLLWEARLSHLLHRGALAPRLLEAASAPEIYEVFAKTREAPPSAESAASSPPTVPG